MTRLERWLLSTPSFVLILTLLAIGVFKSGVAFEVAAQEVEPTFPLPEPGLTSLSYGLPFLVWVLGIQGEVETIALVTVVVALALLALIAFLAGRNLPRLESRVALIVIVLGSVGVVLLGNLGRHDVLTVGGGLILGIAGRSLLWGVFGTVIMLLGNPEQGVWALLIMFLLSLTPTFRAYRKSALILAPTGLVLYIILVFWARSLGIESRLDWFDYHFQVSLWNFFGNLPLSLYAAFGVAWVLVFWALLRTRGFERAVVLVALVVLPLVLTAITMDQTRVFVGVSSVALGMLLVTFLPEFIASLTRLTPNTLAWAFLVAVALPALEIYYAGAPRTPYMWVYQRAVDAGLLSPLGLGPW